MPKNKTENKHNPSKRAKLFGNKSLTHVSKRIDVETRTLYNWSKHKPMLFDAVMIGVFFMDRIESIMEVLKPTEKELEEDDKK